MHIARNAGASLFVSLHADWLSHGEGDADGATRSAILQLHKTVGVAILLLTLARFGWRRLNPPPAMDSSLTPLEKLASHWVHVGFYSALLALPLTGWALVSAQRIGAMKLVGGVRWPDFPLITRLPGPVQDLLADLTDKAHTALVWVMFALLALHVLGALKHHFVSKDATVSRMAPGATPGRILEPRFWAAPVIIAALAGRGASRLRVNEAKLAAVVVVFFWNYTLSKLWAFK